MEPRFGLCTPIAVAEAGLSVSRGAGSGEAATRTRGRATGLSVRSSCRRFGRSLEESTPGAMTIKALILRANNALFPREVLLWNSLQLQTQPRRQEQLVDTEEHEPSWSSLFQTNSFGTVPDQS